MNKRYALPLAILLAALTPQAVADKCKGEASGAIHLCSCTVRSRLQAGW